MHKMDVDASNEQGTVRRQPRLDSFSLDVLADHLFDRMRWTHLLTPIPIIIFSLVLRNAVPFAWLTVWLVAMLIIEASLVLITELKLRRLVAMGPRGWLNLYFVFHLFASLGWALAGVAFFQPLGAWPQIVIAVILLGVVLGGLSALSWHWPTYASGNAIVLLPLGLWFILQGQDIILVSLGFSALVVLGISNFVSWREYRERMAFIRAETEKTELRNELDLHRAELSRMRSRYSSLRDTDPLTGVMGLEKWKEELHKSIGQRHQDDLGVFLIDIRKFIRINQRWGKSVGDRVLQVVARRLTELFGQSSVCRLSADEFLVMQRVRNKSGARDIANRISRYLTLPLLIKDIEISVEPAIGVALCPEHGRDVDTLLENASLANHHMKTLQGATHTVYARSLAETTKRLIDLELSLKKAIEREELYLAYQPQVMIESGEIVGAEALLRWNSKKLGNVSPAEFIPVAEQSGLIIPIGRWVMEQVCRDLARWQADLGMALHIAINVSPVQLKNSQFCQQLIDSLDYHDIDPFRLHVEITESAIMENPVQTIRVLRDIRATGIKLALDDFGTGYSSLGYLRNLEIDYLKLDQSFIRGINTNSKDREITRSVITLAKALGLHVVAEGIETDDVRQALIDQGCESGQGWYFGRPMPLADFEALIRQKRQERSDERQHRS
ncbi:EAL domain-containing protein [Marinobacteraceae bacterium S3BR75-40.1]